MTCKLCKESPLFMSGFSQEKGTLWTSRTCAFPHETFSCENASCTTLGLIRSAAEELGLAQYVEDERVVVVPIMPEESDHFGAVIVSWYKNRMNTQNACFLEFAKRDGATALTCEQAEHALGVLEAKLKGDKK